MKKTIVFLAAVASLTAFAAPNPPTAEDPMISITPVMRSMGQTGGSAASNTSGSGTWRASTSANWILLTSSSGAAGYPVGYTVSANNGVEARVGYVYVSGYVHTITQAGLGATLASYSAAFESEGGTGSVRVNAPSGKTWHAQSNADWIAVSTESGTGTGDCSFTVAAFDEVSTRSGTLTIADNTFTVYQTGLRIQLKTTSATTDYFEGTVKIRVNALADTAWTVSVDADWLTVTDAGNGLGGDEVKVAVAENPSYNERTGTVTIGTETFSVRQLGRTDLVFKIAPTEVGTFGVDGATSERLAVTATPDLGWTAAASADWIEFYSGYDAGSGNGTIVYKVKPNPTLHPRSGTITVTAAAGGVAAKRLDIAQEAAVATLTVEQYEFEAAGESLTVGVNTGSIVEWGVTNLPEWLSVSAASSTGPADIVLTAAANTSVLPRSGVVRIADHEFQVSQKGRGVSITYGSLVFDADGKATGGTADNAIAVAADADVTWSAVPSDDTWIIVYEGKTGQGDGTVRFIVAPYVGAGELRTGMITIGSEIVYVTQRPYDLSIDPIGTWTDGNAGAGEIQVALDIEGVWNAIATEPWITIVSGYDAGTGSGKVLFSYTDNNTGRQRTGKIIIAGETYTLTQAARQLVAVSASAGGHGGIVTGGGTYSLGTGIVLEAVPEAGYAFDHWILPGGGTSTENPISVTVTTPQLYQAFFSPLALQLAVASASLKGVSLEWTDLPWATELRVFRGMSSNRGQASQIATLANDGSCSYLDATGTEDQAYWYWVEAVGVEDDVWSNGVQSKREKGTFAIAYTNLRGTTHSNPATYREGTAVSFASPSARTGFEFLGWTPAGITADTSGDLTVRANWSQNEYTVRFDLGGATGSMADEPFTYGLWRYLTPTNFSRAGYTFLGWAVRPTAAVAVYDDSESVKNLTTEADGLVTLYAVWLRDGLDDPLPDLGSSASSSDIVAVLVGCVDAGNLGENITSAAEYADFRAWADAVRDGSGAAAGHTGVRDSPHAWLSYALGQGTLLETAPEPGDLVILDFAASESDPSRFDLLFGLEGIAVGDSAKPANLMKTFAVEGAESLEDGFSEDAVEMLFLAPSGGDVAGSVQPASESDAFFFRVVERPLALPPPLYTLSFDSAGGSAVASIKTAAGLPVTEPPAPTKPGCDFAGWSPAFPTTMPGSDTMLTAQWTPKNYTITFDTADGSVVAPITAAYGSSVIEPEAPTKDGYDFAVWLPAFPSTMPLGGATLVAQWMPKNYTITFDTAGGSEVASITAAYGAAVVEPASPTKDDYDFAGWSPAFPTTMPLGGAALTAQWTPKNYTIAFDTAGGSAVSPITAAWGSLVTEPDAPTKDGHDFAGWSPAFPATMPLGGSTLTAQWTPKNYTITFETAGGSEVESITAAYGSVMTAPAAPTKQGYDFAGWSPAFPATMPLGGSALTAQWTADPDFFKWTVSGNAATITGVNQTPSGSLDLPSEIDGVPVTGIGQLAFLGCHGLTSVTIPDSVTSIGGSAFANCSGLTSITIPDSVTSIGDGVFSGCSGVTSLSVGTNNPAYYSLDGLLLSKDGNILVQAVNATGNISVPVGVTSIGNSAFSGCSRLESVVIPNGVKNIGMSAFASCSGLTSVAIPDSVASIGSLAFLGCRGLTSVTIPDSVTSIGGSAFANCSSLATLSLPGRFEGNISDMGIPSGCTVVFRPYTIHFDANGGAGTMDDIEGVRVGENVGLPSCGFSRSGWMFVGWSRTATGMVEWSDGETVEGGLYGFSVGGVSTLFARWSQGFYTVHFEANGGTGTMDDAAFWFDMSQRLPQNAFAKEGQCFAGWATNGTDAAVFADGEPVRNLADVGETVVLHATWANHRLLYSVSAGSATITGVERFESGVLLLPSMLGGCPVTSIGNSAFSGCRGLTAVTIPDGVTSIGSSAFSNCSGLTSVTIPASVMRIGNNAFNYCSSLTSILIPDGVTSIESSAFGNCSKLMTISIPASVTSIGAGAFSGCTGVTSFFVDSANPSYSSLDGLLLSKDGTTLVQGVNGIVTIPSCVTAIGNSSFKDCSGLTSIVIPNGVTNIGNDAFSNCSKLTSVTIPDSVTSIGDNAFGWCRALPTITIPNGVTSIGNNACYYCSSLTSITIPNGVTSIGSSAFYNCAGLTSVTIPASVTSIGNKAFSGCTGVTSFSVDAANLSYSSLDGLLLSKDGTTLVHGLNGGVTIPSCVTRIGNSAFEGCSGLTSITIPDGVTSIGNDAFSNCSKLTSVTIPDSVTSIGNSAFWWCGALTTITIPDGVISIGNNAFSSCSSLATLSLPGRFEGNTSNMGIPSGCTVTFRE